MCNLVKTQQNKTEKMRKTLEEQIAGAADVSHLPSVLAKPE